MSHVPNFLSILKVETYLSPKIFVALGGNPLNRHESSLSPGRLRSFLLLAFHGNNRGSEGRRRKMGHALWNIQGDGGEGGK